MNEHPIQVALGGLALVALVACGNASYANDWSDRECGAARGAALMDGDDQTDRVASYTVHCCEGEDDDGEVIGCRG